MCKPGPVRRVFELAKLVETLGVVSSVRDYRQGQARSPHPRRTAAVPAEGPSPA